MIYNLNKHDINIYVERPEKIDDKPSFQVICIPRFSQTEYCDVVTTENYKGFVDYNVFSIPVVKKTFSNIVLPSNLPNDGYLLVNLVVLEAAKVCNHPLLNRMLVPDTGVTAIRNPKGQIDSVTRLVGA